MDKCNDKQIEIRNLQKFYWYKAKKRIVLECINTIIERGKIVAILGRSGCGKTTLLRLICGFEHPDGGEVLIDSQKVLSPSIKTLMIFQDYNQLLPWKTVLQNVALPLMITKKSTSIDDAEKKASELLKDVGLMDFAGYYPNSLSVGMKQRVAIARAIVLKPSVLLMDEPFSALDDYNRNSLQRLTKGIARKHGITVVFVTHSVQEALIISDRIIVLGGSPTSIIGDFINDESDLQCREELTKRIEELINNVGH